MNRPIILLASILLFGYFDSGNTIAQPETIMPQLEVYYTHSTNRCAGCRAIEDQTIETLQHDFKTELEQGIIMFKAINIDEVENESFVEKYEVWGSSLFIIKNGSGEKFDLTRDGFAYARTRPAIFREKLASVIKSNMD